MEKFKSRKFWFAFLGALLPLVAQYLTGDIALAEALKLSSAVIVTYLLGQGYVDGQGAKQVKD